MKKMLVFLTVLVLSMTGTNAYTQSQLDAANILALEWIIFDSSAKPSGYNLDKNVLRQEIAAVAIGVADITRTFECAEKFSDVSARNPNTWACYSIEPLLNAGIIALNDTFRPEENITKAEGLGMLVKAACGDDYNYETWRPGTWQEQLVTYASTNDITSSFTDYDSLATRGWVFEIGAVVWQRCNETIKIEAGEPYVNDGKIFLGAGTEKIHITQNIENIGECEKIGEGNNQVRYILGSNDTYVIASIFGGVCGGGGGESVYLINQEDFSYIPSLNPYLSKTYGDNVLYQYIGITDDKIIINVFHYNEEPTLGYNATIIDRTKTIEGIIREDTNREFIEKKEILIEDLLKQ